MRMASSSLSVPTPVVSAVYSGSSKETLTCDCAPKLYTSRRSMSGCEVLIWERIPMRLEESVRSPYFRCTWLYIWSMRGV